MAECEICREEVFYEKLLLCCQNVKHYFCQTCLEKLKKRDGESTDVYVVICPKCRSSTVLPEGKVENLQTKIHAKLRCEECGEEKKLDEQWWCENCSMLICGNCGMRKHREHKHCCMFEECVMKTYATHLRDIFAEQCAVEKQINDLCDEIKRNMLSIFNLEQNAHSDISGIKSLVSTIGGTISQDDKKTTQANLQKQIKFFCQVLKTLPGQQTLDVEKVNSLLEWKRKVSFFHYFDQVCESIKSNCIPTKQLNMVKTISVCHHSFIQLILVPKIGFCVLEGGGIKMLTLEKGNKIRYKYWENLDINPSSSAIFCITYIANIECILITSVSSDKCAGFILDASTLKLEMKLDLKNMFISADCPVLVGCSSNGHLIVASSNGERHSICCYLFSKINDKIKKTISYNLDNTTAARYEKFTQLLIGSESQHGQIVLITGTSVVYKFRYTIEKMDLLQTISMPTASLSNPLLINFNDAVFWFHNESRKLVCFDKDVADCAFSLEVKRPKILFAVTVFGHNNSIFVVNGWDLMLYQYT